MAEPLDNNHLIASLLRDLASVQPSTQRQWGYKRAAAALLDLEEPIEQYLQNDGTLRKIANIGPSSTRIILEVLRTGSSATVDAAVAASPQIEQVERARGLREHFLSRAQVVAALANRALRGPLRQDYRGDLQMHSTWSDGSESLDALVDGCLERGYQYRAITDHSYGLPVAHGVSMADLRRQHREIDALNHAHEGRFRMLKGIEANITADGQVDMTLDERRSLEIVVASPHSALRVARDQTSRMVTAVSQPAVHILGHPRGRMFSSRPGVTADWDAVFEAAAASGVAIEIRWRSFTAGRRLRPRPTRGCGRVPPCAGQRRALASTARLRRRRHRTCAARVGAHGAGDQHLAARDPAGVGSGAIRRMRCARTPASARV